MASTNFLAINDILIDQSPTDGCVGNYWLNPNIKISTGIWYVDQPATITIDVHNTSGYGGYILNYVQATVCALNTITGFNKDTILPSLRTSNPLVFESKDLLLGPGQITNQPGTPPVVLGPWTPTAEDIAFFAGVRGAVFENLKTDLHVCVFANCGGVQAANPGITDGEFVNNWADFVGGTFCTDRHHGQLNTTLHRTSSTLTATVAFHAGIGPGRGGGGGGGGGGGNAKVFVREPVFDPQADRGLVEMIRHAGLGGLPVQPAPLPARVAGIARFRSVAERIEEKAEAIVDEAREALEHLRGHWADEDDESNAGTPRNVVTLQLAPGGLQPLLLKVAFDKDDPLGAVHVFDVIQLNQDGNRGGFRLATINTPAE